MTNWQIVGFGGDPVASTEEVFAHLHGHSKYSLKDALSDIPELIEAVAARGMNAVAVTDHRVMYGSFELYEAAKLFSSGRQKKGLPGVKPIIGCELNEVDDRTDPSRKGTYHLPVVAISPKGYSNLVQIVSDAATTGMRRHAGDVWEETDLTFIEANNLGEGIVALTGCVAGRLPRLLIGKYDDQGNQVEQPDPVAALAWLNRLKRVFQHVVIELQFHSNPLQKLANVALIEMAAKTQTPMVVTRDYHYIRPEDGAIHDVYVSCASGWREGYDSHDYFLTSPKEMYDWLRANPQLDSHANNLGVDLAEALRNTQRVANAVVTKLPEAYAHFPAVVVPGGHDPRGYLRKLCFDELIRWSMERRIDLKVYVERLEYELKIIDQMGVVPYFLTLWRVIRWCQYEANPEIPVGPGRGSGAGSLVLALLGIVDGDPIEDDLLFERFLNPERAGLPDVDIDIADDDRPRVIQFILETWGADYVAQIGTHGTLSVKQATIDLIKTLDNPSTGQKYTQEEAQAITKPIPAKWPDQSDLTFDKMREVLNDPPDEAIIGELEQDDIEDMRKVANEYFNAINQVPGLPEAINRVEGAKKSFGLHAGGIIISGIPIKTVCPVSKVPKSAILPATQYDMNQVAKLGLIKYDFLGLRTLRVIKLALKFIEKTTGRKIAYRDLSKIIDRDDPKIWKPVAMGQTHGIFQFSGKAVADVSRRVRVSNYAEGVDCVSLGRPGPLDAEVSPGKTMVDAYVEGGDANRPPKPLHPALEQILGKTRQVVVYQEQVQKVVQRVAGYSLGGGDNFRRVISKKDLDAVKALREEFLHGSTDAVPRLEAIIADAKAKGIQTSSYEKMLKDIRERADTRPVPGAVAMGFEEEFSTMLMDALAAFAGYGFNKSHAARYVNIAVICLWLKCYHPTEFMAALLTTEANNVKKLPGNISEARRLQLDLLGPDINSSDVGFDVDVVNGKPAIRYGLLAIKGCGEGIVEEVIAKRPYADFNDFLIKVDQRKVNKTAILALIKAGCFDSIEPNRYKLWNYFCFNVRRMLPEGTQTTKKSAEFAVQYDEAEWDKHSRLEWENESLGIFITGHPLDDHPYARWNETPNGKKGVETAGIIRKVKKHNAKNGEMAWVTIETQEDKRDLTFFANTWKNYTGKLKEGDIIIATGKKDGDNLLVDKVEVKGKAKAAPGAAPAKAAKAPKKSTAKNVPGVTVHQQDLFGEGLDLDGMTPLPDTPVPVGAAPAKEKKPDPLADLFLTSL